MRRLSTLILLLFITSCSTKKDIIYLQNIDKQNSISFDYSDYLIKSGDILDISLVADNPENLVSLNQSPILSNNYSQNRESLIFDGYFVDNNGFIEYPQVGKIKADEMTIGNLSKIISEKLNENEILTNSIVEIKVLNLNFTIIGEVNKPGKYYFDQPRFNIIQAIGKAGDLTINGERKKIKLIRHTDGEFKLYNIDLTSYDLLSSDSFQIVSGDIIIVDPNASRVKNAGIIGNSGTLLSLLSFILSTIIVTTR